MNKSSKFLGCGLLVLGLFVACGGDDSPSTGGHGGAGGSGAKATGGGPANEGGGPSEGGAGGGATIGTLANPIHVVPSSTEKSPDGSEAHPFASLYAAIDAINADGAWDGKIIVHAGRLELPKEVILPPTADLEVQAGTTFALGYLVAFHAQRDVKVLGKEGNEVVFTWLDEGQHWSGFTLFEPTSVKNVFEYAVFEHGYEVQFKEVGMRGALSIYQARARISHCTFQNNEGDDGLGVKATKSLVEYSKFLNNAGDALDSDKLSGIEIAHNYFAGNANDAIDLGEGSDAYIHDNVVASGKDKGVSIGEGSAPIVDHNLIVGCVLGIGNKDDSKAVITNNTLYGNDIGFASYAAASGYGAGDGVFSNNIIWNSKMADVDMQDDSETVFSYNCIEDLKKWIFDPDAEVWTRTDEDAANANGVVADAEGIISVGTGCDDPLFADPANMDFHLQSAAGRFVPETMKWAADSATSPCIDSGDPSAEVGDEPAPNGSRIDMGNYGGTGEASKSP